MRGINRVTIAGHLGADPEQRQFTNGSVTYFSVATSEKWTDKQTGEAKEATEWHRIVCFGKLSDVAIKYLRKGSKIYVEGSLRTRKWQDQNNQDRYTTEVRADRLEFLDDNPNTNSDSYNGNNQQNYNGQNNQNQTYAKNQPQQNNQNDGNNPNQPNQPSQEQMPPPNSGGGDDEDIPFAPFFGG